MKKRRIPSEKIKQIENIGKDFGNNKHVQKIFQRLNDYGTRHPKKFFIIVIIIMILIIIWGFFGKTPTPNTEIQSIPVVESKYNDSIKNVQRSYISDVEEIKEIRDSVNTLLQKKNLSKEDSMFIIEKTTYFKKLAEEL